MAHGFSRALSRAGFPRDLTRPEIGDGGLEPSGEWLEGGTEVRVADDRLHV